MKINVLSFICLLVASSACLGKMAIIKDKDGFTNMRKRASGKSDVVAKVSDNEVFDVQLYNRKGNWVPVVYKNKKGYMHSSRVLLLSQLKPYKGKAVSIVVVNKPFNKSLHKITKKKIKDDEGKVSHEIVDHIDGKTVWGTDGGLPSHEVKSITITLNGEKMIVKKALYSNFYQMSGSVEKIAKKGDTYFIQQICSDGAGCYLVTWIVSKKHGVKVAVGEADF